jgi:hypothetical protein
MLHFKERVAVLAAVNDRAKRISFLTFGIYALKPCFV